MSEKKNWDKIAKIEKSIKDKYGEETIRHPKDGWSDDAEAEHIEQLKLFAKKEQVWRTKTEKVEQQEGVFVSKKLLNTEDGAARVCPVCKKYSFDPKDDLYMIKFECCWSCYIDYVEGREEKWNEGWRPQD